jgi:hypothetical protein
MPLTYNRNIILNNSYLDGLANGNESSWVRNLEPNDENIAVLREDVTGASVDEIIDMIHGCLQAESELSLVYVLTFMSRENMHEVARRLDDQHIVDILSLLERRRNWYILSFSAALNEEGRRSAIRNAAPANIQRYMDSVNELLIWSNNEQCGINNFYWVVP